MKTLRHNLRWASLLLTLNMVLATTLANAAWQCQDGTPCSMIHPLLSRAALSGRSSQADHFSPCRHCSSEKRTVQTHLATAPCVLGWSAAPAAILERSSLSLFSVVALLPEK